MEGEHHVGTGKQPLGDEFCSVEDVSRAFGIMARIGRVSPNARVGMASVGDVYYLTRCSSKPIHD
jgi:hypothetical protein